MKSDYALSALGLTDLPKPRGVALGYYILRLWRCDQNGLNVLHF